MITRPRVWITAILFGLICGAGYLGGKMLGDAMAPDTAPVVVETSPNPAHVRDEDVVRTLKERLPQWNHHTTAVLVKEAQVVCRNYKVGLSFVGVNRQTQYRLGLQESDAAFFMGVATAAYCPEYAR